LEFVEEVLRKVSLVANDGRVEPRRRVHCDETVRGRMSLTERRRLVERKHRGKRRRRMRMRRKRGERSGRRRMRRGRGRKKRRGVEGTTSELMHATRPQAEGDY